MRGPTFNSDYLKNIIDYDQNSGLFRWKCQDSAMPRIGPRSPLRKVGTHGKDGYIRVSINGRQYAAHRLAWMFVTGEWPSLPMDHINRIRDDNRWGNLRLASPSQNSQNRGVQSNSKSGVKGVFYGRKDKCWIAEICINYKKTRIGTFQSKEEARDCYLLFSRELYGQFAPRGETTNA